MKLTKLFKKKIITTGNSIIDFYNNYDEEGRLMRKSRMPEYLNTMKYIEKYILPNAKIIEIGAGTGRYSIALAEMGYDAIKAVGHGESGSYTVILNRTKVIFCKGGSIYGN